MADITFVTGGARSGKSRFAEELLRDAAGVLYIATAIPFDVEMKQRIALHRERRDPRWRTLEAWQNLGSAIEGCGKEVTHVLLDCLTIMVSNHLTLESGIDWESPDRDNLRRLGDSIAREVEGLIDGSRRSGASVIVVSSETGMGIVPAYPLGRHFRDFAGSANQAVAAAADRVYLLVSGIPVRIKG